MAKKNTKIQKQLEEGLKNANQVVDEQIEGKAAPKAPKTPAAAAPSAPAAGATPVVPGVTQSAGVTADIAFEAEIAKIIKGNPAFVATFRDIRDQMAAGGDAMGLNQKVITLATNISNSTKGKIPAKAIEGFLTEKLTAQTSPAVVQAQEAAPPALVPETAPGVVETPPAQETLASVAPTPLPEDAGPVFAPKIPQEVLSTPEAVKYGLDDRGYINGGDSPFGGQIPALDAWEASLTPAQLEALRNRNFEGEAPVQEAPTPEPAPETPQKTTTASTPVQPGGVTDDVLAMLQEADATMSGTREDASIDRAEAKYFGSRTARTDEEINKPSELEVGNADNIKIAKEIARRKRLKELQQIMYERLAYGSVTPEDDLYNLYERYIAGEGGVRGTNAKNMLNDPESVARGSLTMRIMMLHYGIGYVKESEMTPRLKEMREKFDSILRSLGIEDSTIKGIRREIKATRDSEWTPLSYGDREAENVEIQKRLIDSITATIQKLKGGGALRRPEVAPALDILTKLITELDSDIIEKRTINFDPRKPVGKPLQTFVDRLEYITDELVEKVKALTGEDIKTVTTETGEIPRPSWSPLLANGQYFTTNNVINYETRSRRRYALDLAGLVDQRWQEVDVQGIDVPSFVNTMNPNPDSTRAAIGFILTTDPTTGIHYESGIKIKRDFKLEGSIIKALKEHLGQSGFDDSSKTWDDGLTFDSDIGVGDNITYTTDKGVVEAEVSRRRLMLPKEPVVIARVDRGKFPNSVVSDGKGTSRLIGEEGIVVLPADSPLVQVIRTNGGSVTRPFVIGSEVDISSIAGPDVFSTLLIDIDPHVFPAVKHTLPLVDPMGRRGTVAMIPVSFAKTGEPVRITVRDRDGIPSRKLVPTLDENGNVIYIDTGTQKTFSQGGEGKAKRGTDFGIDDVLPGDTTPFTHEGRAVLRVRDVDVSASAQDWPEGIAAAIVADSDGNFPNLGTLADRYLADIDTPDEPRRWVLGDLLGVEQGDDRPGRVASGDQFFGLMHGGITDAELERGRALIKQIDAEIEAGTPHRARTVLTPDEESMVALAKSTMQPTGGTEFSPARTTYDAAEVFESSEDGWQVKHRERREALVRTPEEGDPILRDVGTDEIMLSSEPITPDVEKELRVLKADLLTLLKIRATKAFWDRKNATEPGRDAKVQDIVDLAPRLAAIRTELARVGVVDAAYQQFVIDAIDNVAPFDNPEDEAFFRQEMEKEVRRLTLSEVIPVTSGGGYGVSRGFGAGNNTFLSPEDLGLNSLDQLDNIAYKIARDMTMDHLAARKGAPQVSMESIYEQLGDQSGTEDNDLIDSIKEMGSDVEKIVNLAEDDPDALRMTPETKKLSAALKQTKDPMFRSLIVALMENGSDMRAVIDSAYPEEFAKAMLQQDKQKPSETREFAPRKGQESINRGLLPDGSRDPYDTRMQELWVEYASNNVENVGRKIGKTVKRTMVPSDTETSLAVGLSPAMRPSVELKGLLSGLTTEQIQTVAQRAYTAFSIFAARDDAGDGWVRFINNVLHADEAAKLISSEWEASGRRMIMVNPLVLATGGGEPLELKTQSGGDIGILTSDEVEKIRAQSDRGSAYVDMAEDNQMNFIVIKKRTPSGKVDQTVYIVRLSDKQRKNPTTMLDFSDVEELTMKYGYQPMADEMQPSQTEDRIKAFLKETGADRFFGVIMDPAGTGRYTLGVKPDRNKTSLLSGRAFEERPLEFDTMIEEMEKLSDSQRIKKYKMIIDALVKFKFYEDINRMAVDSGVEPPFKGITLKRVMVEVEGILKDAKGVTTGGETSGPFGIRVAMNLKNKNLPSDSIIPRILTEETIDGPMTVEERIARALSKIDDSPAVGDDPMLDAALQEGTIRNSDVVKELTKRRAGGPEGTRRRVETDATKALARTAKAMIKSGRLNDLLNSGPSKINKALNSRTGGFIGGGLLTLGMAAGMQGLRDKEREEMVKTGLAFEALGAVSPALSNAAALGFTAMNKGDMLRTLINIIGGFGGAAAGAVAGTAVLPVGGSFAGGMAGSVAGSAAADALYSQFAGGGSTGPRVPYNTATLNEQAVPEEEDPFNVFKGLGG
jgi:hypothetical protein